MSRMSWIVVLAAASLALPAAAETCQPVVLGAGVTLAETVPVEQILDRPDEYVGREVAIVGEVADVCQKAGCWLELRAAAGERTLQVKVEDGVIVFPKDARGAQAKAQGTVEKLDLDREAYTRRAEHMAEEQGRTFDPASVPAEGPWVAYRLRGTGAELCR